MKTLSMTPEARRLVATALRSCRQYVWVFDVDDTIVDTIQAHKHAADALGRTLADSLSRPAAEALANRFDEMFQLLVAYRQVRPSTSAPDWRRESSEYLTLKQRVLTCQDCIKHQWGVTKTFSREVLLQLAAEDCEIAFSVKDIVRASDSYWAHIRDHSIWFPDSKRLISELSAAGTPVYLMTSSDAVFSPVAGPEQFIYDPNRSRAVKLSRLEVLRSEGLTHRRAFVGDPVDKPDPAFFQLVYSGIEKDMGRPLDLRRAIFIGDSFQADLEVPVLDDGAALGILCARGQETMLIEDERLISVGNLTILLDYLRDSK